jgi:competence protein ComEA
MKHLVWTRRKPEVRAEGGLLVLLLAIMMLSFLRVLFDGNGYPECPNCPELFVQIQGDIKYPGVYFFRQEPNFKDLMVRCGGLEYGRDVPVSVSDITFQSGERISVKTDEYKFVFYKGGISAFHKITLGLPISLNRESEEGLSAIPGIGPGLADLIVRERSRRGGFKDLDEIKSLSGIGDRTYRKIAPYVKL